MKYSLELQQRFPIPKLRVALTVKEIEYLQKYTDFQLFFQSDKTAFLDAQMASKDTHIILDSIEQLSTSNTRSPSQLLAALLKIRPQFEDFDFYLQLLLKLKEIETFWVYIEKHHLFFIQSLQNLRSGLE